MTRVFGLLALLWLLSACQSGVTVQRTDETPSSPTRLVEIKVGDAIRDYWLHVPPDLPDEPRPLVVLLHGYGDNGLTMMQMGGFFRHAAREGYLVLAPNAVDVAFNDGSGRGDHGIDDVGYVIAAVRQVIARERVHPGRVYLVGYSAGGGLAMRLVLAHADLFAGLMVVGDHLWTSSPVTPVSIDTLFVYGARDPRNPVDGGVVTYGETELFVPAAKRTYRRWGRIMECGITVSADFAFMRQVVRQGCRNGAQSVMMILNEHGAYWPASLPANPSVFSDDRLGPYNNKVDGAAAMWRFFEGG